MEMLLQFMLLVIGFVLLIKGADWFVDGASKIADKFHIPQLVIGLTIVAFGTSAPEAAVGITAGLKGNADIALGNVLGSNVMNILLILGITSVIIPVSIQESTLKFEVPFVILISVLILFLGKSDGTIGLMDGIILWVFFLVFLFYLLQLAKKGQTIEDIPESGENDRLWKMVLATIIGLIAIVWGSNLTVDSASYIAKKLGLGQRFIGLTIVAFGTSLPELVTSATAALKGKADIAIGNILGSNIFNLLFVLGTTAIIVPLNYAQSFVFDNIICILSAVLLFVCVLKNKKLTRSGGIIMLVCYAAYFIRLYLSI